MSGTGDSDKNVGRHPLILGAQQALQDLALERPELAAALAGLIEVIATEIHRNRRFANLLERQLTTGFEGSTDEASVPPRRARREPGPWDPFQVYADGGETALRTRLSALDLEQLRNIIAEHGMDTDRLAMKWRDAERVIDRIVDRVVDRAAKGEGFRAP